MSMPSPIRMVCFDAGGVLVRICRSWREGCEAAGVPYRWNTAAEAREPERATINAAYQRGQMRCETFFERIAATSEGLYRPEEVRTIHEAWILGEYPGVREMVDTLNTADGLVTGLLSNTSELHWSQQLMAGGAGVSAIGRLRHAHASHLLGLIKPDPEVYRAFERATGFAPGSILFFDDLPENVAAARALGWRAELVDHAGDTTAQIMGVLAANGLVSSERASCRCAGARAPMLTEPPHRRPPPSGT